MGIIVKYIDKLNEFAVGECVKYVFCSVILISGFVLFSLFYNCYNLMESSFAFFYSGHYHIRRCAQAFYRWVILFYC